MPSPLDSVRGGRGSGRTFRMVRFLPEGAVVIVPNAVMGAYVREMIERQHGRAFNDTIQVTVILNEVGVASLDAMRRPIFVDHSFWEQPSLSYSVGRRLESLIERQCERAEDRARTVPPPSRSPTLDSYLREFVSTGFSGATSMPVNGILSRTNTTQSPRRRPQNSMSQAVYDGPEAEDL